MEITDKIYKLFLLIVLLCFNITSVDAKLFGAKEFYLKNGLHVIVIPNHKAPIVKQMLWYKVGSADEYIGKGGAAHLLEHLMFRGTNKIKDRQFNTLLEQNGADSNAFTSLDYTAYHQSLDISKLELAMAMEADRMQNLCITPKNFELERNIVYQERKQVIDNNPISPFIESYRKLIWGNHPYGRPVTGTSEEIKNLKLEDINDFYQKYYTPNNAILVLSGDIDVNLAHKLAEKYYGTIKARKILHKNNLSSVHSNNDAYLRIMLPQINTERILRTYLAPSFNQDKNTAYNLIVFSKYLGEGETSELYKSLVLDRKLAINVSSDYNYVTRGQGQFNISILPANGVTSEELNLALDEEISKAIKNISAEKISQVKSKLLSGLVYLQDNPFDAAEVVGRMAAVGISVNDIENHADNLRKVTYQNVKEAGRKLLSSSRTIGVLSPKGVK